MAHTDNYKIPRVSPTSPTSTQNTKSTSELIGEIWPWGQKPKEQFCSLSLQEAIDTHFSPDGIEIPARDAYWTEFLKCIIDGHPTNDKEKIISMRILKNELCDEHSSSTTVVSKVSSTFFLF